MSMSGKPGTIIKDSIAQGNIGSTRNLQVSRNKLSLDERDDLKAFIASDQYRSLLKYFDLLLLDRQRALTDYDLANGTERLFSLKAEYDGAKKFLASVKANLQTIKKR